MSTCKQITVADFETTTSKDDCRVWAWGICNIVECENVDLGTDITSFMSKVTEYDNICYFHNLRFDGQFILYWLFKNNYRFNADSRNLSPGEFSTMISDMGVFYTLTLMARPNTRGVSTKIEFRDSLKIIPMAVEEIPKSFGLEESKLSIDYNEYREIGHQLTEQERLYVRADIVIVAKAIKYMRDKGQVKLTSAANALADFKARYKPKEYKRLFPQLNSINDKDIRESYKGGWTYLNPKYKNKSVSEGRVYDVNSMYPWAMKYCLLPYGEPVFYTGRYKELKTYPLYVQKLTCEFKLKPGKYPSIQIKGSKIYGENEYIEESIYPTTLCLTSVDLELFFHNYEIIGEIEWHHGYMFKAAHGMFTDYIDYWYEQKTNAKASGNKGLEAIAKLMLNSLYGKFGARMTGFSKIPYFDASKDMVRFKKSDEEERKGGYLPIATFITSYCRDKIIRAAEVCGERFIYADTDSVHIEGDSDVPGMDVDEFRLGAFKLEQKFIRAKFIRQKTYLEIALKNGKESMNIKCCGMPKEMKKTITEDEFYEGAIYDNSENDKYAPKLMPQIVPGGVILKETTFQIKKPKALRTININYTR